jgi:hypothetical protein
MISRYSYTSIVEGKSLTNSDCVRIIQEGIKIGEIDVDVFSLAGEQRLDVLSGQFYGTSEFWWVIAAASGIGWGLQVPPGTLLRVPKDISRVLALL